MATRKKTYKKSWGGIASQSKKDLSVIEKENSESEDMQAVEPVDTEKTQLSLMDQLGYEKNDNNIAAQLILDVKGLHSLCTIQR